MLYTNFTTDGGFEIFWGAQRHARNLDIPSSAVRQRSLSATDVNVLTTVLVSKVLYEVLVSRTLSPLQFTAVILPPVVIQGMGAKSASEIRRRLLSTTMPCPRNFTAADDGEV